MDITLRSAATTSHGEEHPLNRNHLLIMNLGLVMLAVVTTSQPPALATPPGQTPEEFTQAYFAGQQEGIFDQVASRTDPNHLADFRKTMLWLLEESAKDGQDGQILGLFGVKSAEALEAMGSEAFFAAYMRGTMRMQPDVQVMLKNATFAALGHVAEGPDHVHVVYGLTMDGMPLVNVISLRRQANGWLAQLKGDAQAMRVRLKVRRAAQQGGFEDMSKLTPKIHTVKVLGKVQQGDSRAHVVYRATAKVLDEEMKAMYHHTVEATEPLWAAVMAEDWAKVTAAIEEQLGVEKPAPKKSDDEASPPQED